MRVIIYTFIFLLTLGCVSNQEKKQQDITEKADKRYTIGIVHQDYNHPTNKYKYNGSVTGGVVVLKISTDSTSHSSGIKSGWVLLEVDGKSLIEDGQDILSQRIQDPAKADVLDFKVYDGNETKRIYLRRHKGILNVNSYKEIN